MQKGNMGERNIDPAEDFLFDKLPPLGAIIRESAQNSLDAANDGETVRMRISVKTGQNAMSPSVAKKYFENLFPHLKESKMNLPDLNSPMDYVVVEDFGTKGLEGDGEYFGLGDDAPENRFYWFHRNTNRTNENLTKRGGSYGYGKFAFANASLINTFFSVSRDKNGIKIFGNSVAKMHVLDGKMYRPYGDFGDTKSFGSQGSGIIPSSSPELFNQMCEDFDLTRGNDLGLSVIIPFPEKIYRDKEIITSMIRAYFLPICQGKLVVEVDNGGGHCIIIDSDSISKICDKQSWSKTPAGSMTSTSRKCMNGLIDLASWWCSDFSSEIQLASPSENNIHWSPDLIPSEKYDTIRAKLDSGKPLALTIDVPIFKKKDNRRNERYASISKFTILLKKDESYGRSDAVWIRRYLSVPNKPAIPQNNGFIAIVISEKGELESLLRTSEDVAHTIHRISRVEKKYQTAGDIVRFYRKSASTLIGYLQTKSELFEKDWIDDWFPSEEIENQNKPRRKRKKKKKSDNEPEDTEEDDLIIGPPKPPEDFDEEHSFELQKLQGGFSIHGEIKLGLDLLFRVKMGYSRDDGKDAIKKWKPFDFTLENLEHESSGIEMEKIEGNTLVFTAIGPTEEFYIDVTGFDSNRDLYVHTKRTLQRGESDGE
ncbi:hypothetical protein OAT73_06170 [Candidatus Poseidoniaceae archaeon]|nr:hypothetical protein [Candidatus Poseidoniaceae archaeon]